MEFFYSKVTGFKHITFLKYRLRYAYFPIIFFLILSVNTYRRLILFATESHQTSNIKRIQGN